VLARVFLDTSYVIALTVASDQFHEEAVRLAKQMELAGVRMVTTYGVLLEFGNAMSKRRFRTAGLQLPST